MQNRRRSPATLLLTVVLAVCAPVAVVMTTGLDNGSADDRVETANAAARREADRAAQELRSRSESDDRTPSTSSTVVMASTTTTAAPTTTTTSPPATPAPTEPPTTAPPATAPPPTAPPAPPPASGPADRVVQLVNQARAQEGCGALSVDDRLAAAAKGHSDDMAARGYFSHTSQDGRSAGDRMSAAGYPSPGGENIAQGQRGAEEVHEAWMNSDGHRANILNCGYATIGVGLHADSWTWTQNFGF